MINNKKIWGRYFLVLIPLSFVLGTGLGYCIALLSEIHPSYVPLISTTIGFLVALFIPFWQARAVNPPLLSVELTAIKRTVSDTALISINDDSELRSLKPRAPEEYPQLIFNNISTKSNTKRGSYTLAQTEDLLVDAKRRLTDLPTSIEERKKEYEQINALQTISKYECDRLNRPIIPEVDFDPEAPENSLRNLKDAYKKRLEEVEKNYAELQSSIPAAERRMEILRKELLDNRSFFTVSTSLVNSGRSNTAVKVPALMRVSIGEGNYIDLKLTLKDFENKSEISASGTRIAIFESSEVSTLPEEDRKLINTYWGQSVSARLHLEDIHSKVYSSNTIAFAEGLYQKIIYDRLARAATSN